LVEVGVGVEIGVAAEVGVGVGEGVGVGFAIITPLLHINFLPDLRHVYFIPARVVVLPALVQGEPALTAPNAVRELVAKTTTVNASVGTTFFMPKR